MTSHDGGEKILLKYFIPELGTSLQIILMRKIADSETRLAPVQRQERDHNQEAEQHRLMKCLFDNFRE